MVVEKEITVISVTNSFFCGAFIEICFRRSLPCFLALANLTVVNQIVRPDVYFLSFFSFRMKKPLQCRKRLLNGFVNDKQCKKPIEPEVFSDSDCKWFHNAHLPTNQVFKSEIEKRRKLSLFFFSQRKRTQPPYTSENGVKYRVLNQRWRML